jgi:mediator of RNA polymerase II transcription subunit 12
MAKLAEQIREHAERQILYASRFLCGPIVSKDGLLVDDKQALVRKYLSVIDATPLGPSQEVQPTLLAALIDRFKGAAELLNSWKQAPGGREVVERTSTDFDICFW